MINTFKAFISHAILNFVSHSRFSKDNSKCLCWRGLTGLWNMMTVEEMTSFEAKQHQSPEHRRHTNPTNPTQIPSKNCHRDERLRTKSLKDSKSGRPTALRDGRLPTSDARCTRVSIPSVLRIASWHTYAALVSLGQAEETKADWLAWFKSVEPLFRNFTPTVHDIYEDADANKVVARCTSSACTPVGPYRNEYMIVLYFTKDQRKVERFLEFVDAGASMEFFPRLHKWVAEHPGMKW
jgi:ketosteroid isomerase-like protein